MSKALTPAGFAREASAGRWECPPHLELLNRKLVELAARRIEGLVVEMPPRHGKTLFGSNWFPAWYLGTFPDHQVILVSHGQDFAEEQSAKVQAIVAEHGRRYFGIEVDPRMTAASRWGIKGHAGGMRAVGIGGQLTGRGANCLEGETLIETSVGPIDINTLVRLRYRPEVMTFCHETGTPRWRRIVAVRETRADGLYEIRTVGGRRIRATGEHRFYVPGRGYQPAADLARGDRLLVVQAQPQEQDLRPLREGEDGQGYDLSPVLCGGPQDDGDSAVCVVRAGVRQAPLRVREGVPAGAGADVLLHHDLRPGPPRDQERPQVPGVLEADGRRTGASLLFGGMSGDRPVRREEAEGDHLRDLPGGVPPQFDPDPVLFPAVCGAGPLAADDGLRQLALQGRQELRPALQADASTDPGPGSLGLRGVRGDGGVHGDPPRGEGPVPVDAADPPRQRITLGQLALQSGDALQGLPRGTPQVAVDAVAVVRRLRTPGERVYDIQVEGDCNFFAGEVLVHNCLIMDDLVRDSEDALSEASRRRNRDWLESTAFTRLEPGGVVVLSNTRWHEQDPAGLILAGEVGSHVRWEELRLPALAEDDDPLGRAPGEALWPARYPRAKLESIRASNEANAGASAYWWDALFQARPLPKSGGMFQAEWFEGGNLVTQVPQQADRVRYWDRAASHGKGDYTVGTLMAYDGRFWYVEDVIRGRWAEGDRDSIVRHAAESDDARYGRVAVRGEQEPGSSGKDQAAAFVRMLAKHDVLCAPVTGSKETRARAYAAQCQFGNVKFLRGAPWLAEFVREHVGFPRGKHDDIIDACSGAFNCLCDLGEEFQSAVSGPRRGLA